MLSEHIYQYGLSPPQRVCAQTDKGECFELDGKHFIAGLGTTGPVMCPHEEPPCNFPLSDALLERRNSSLYITSFVNFGKISVGRKSSF